MCKFLIDHGAEINRKGGESVATPLQWAAQRCHYYTVNLLIQHGADPLITDAQGYNTLHTSTFNGNVLLIVLLLHQGIPVDVLDSYGHTALMWAAYKGYHQCVDVFLRWGANVQNTDEQGFTALHWALVKGNPYCILKLIEYGADRFAKTDQGKTPAITAAELNTEAAWHTALRECGYDTDGLPLTPPWPGASYFLRDKRTFILRFMFIVPFIFVWGCLMLVSHAPVFLGVPLAVVFGFGIQWLAKQVFEYAPTNLGQFHKTVCLQHRTSAPRTHHDAFTDYMCSRGWQVSLQGHYPSWASTGSSSFSPRRPSRANVESPTSFLTYSSPRCLALLHTSTPLV
jgi:palmitoyltransferase ZDHHC13/17